MAIRADREASGWQPWSSEKISGGIASPEFNSKTPSREVLTTNKCVHNVKSSENIGETDRVSTRKETAITPSGGETKFVEHVLSELANARTHARTRLHLMFAVQFGESHFGSRETSP